MAIVSKDLAAELTSSSEYRAILDEVLAPLDREVRRLANKTTWGSGPIKSDTPFPYGFEYDEFGLARAIAAPRLWSYRPMSIISVSQAQELLNDGEVEGFEVDESQMLIELDNGRLSIWTGYALNQVTYGWEEGFYAAPTAHKAEIHPSTLGSA